MALLKDCLLAVIERLETFENLYVVNYDSNSGGLTIGAIKKPWMNYRAELYITAGDRKSLSAFIKTWSIKDAQGFPARHNLYPDSRNITSFVYVLNPTESPVVKQRWSNVVDKYIDSNIKYRAKKKTAQEVAEKVLDPALKCWLSVLEHNNFGMAKECDECPHQFSCLVVKDAPPNF